MASTAFSVGGKLNVTLVGESNTMAAHTYDLKNFTKNYAKLSLGKDIFVHVYYYGAADTSGDGTWFVGPSYNAATGILTVPRAIYHNSSSGYSLIPYYRVYLVEVK